MEKPKGLCLWGVNLFRVSCLTENSTLNEWLLWNADSSSRRHDHHIFERLQNLSHEDQRQIGNSFTCLLWSSVALRGMWSGNFWIAICTSSFFGIYGLRWHTPGPRMVYSNEYILTAVIIMQSHRLLADTIPCMEIVLSSVFTCGRCWNVTNKSLLQCVQNSSLFSNIFFVFKAWKLSFLETILVNKIPHTVIEDGYHATLRYM